MTKRNPAIARTEPGTTAALSATIEKIPSRPNSSSMADDIVVTRGSGNVFADLELPNPDEELIKARLAALVRELIDCQRLTQTAAAARMGIAQPDVSNLVRGRVNGFSLERLLEFVRALGSDVEIRVKMPDAEREGRMSLKVA